MCGLAGVVRALPQSGAEKLDATDDVAVVTRMLDRLVHRGPDGRDVVTSAGTTPCPTMLRTVLGATRLAVFDRERGAQPMTSRCGRHVLALNGAIVNHVELRDRVRGHGRSLHSTCDTEVLLELLAAEGTGALGHVNGMFAGVWLDVADGTVRLFRDPCGVKPLFLRRTADATWFASEIKALLVVPGARRERDDAALLDYLTFQVPLGERTFFEGIRQVPAGTVLTLRAGRPHSGDGACESRAPLPAWAGPLPQPGTAAEAAAALGALVRSAVEQHVRSDVALGAHLSGGVDSSLVAALAARRHPTPLPAFVGAFAVDGFDERPHAAAVAAEIGAAVHEVVLDEQTLFAALRPSHAAMDEPMAGPGLPAQWCVARAAADEVTVVLGGQGGDELHAGYVRHLVAHLGAALRDLVGRGDTARMARLAPQMDALRGYEPLLRAALRDGLLGAEGQAYGLFRRGRALGDVLAGDLLQSWREHDPRERFADALHRVARAAPDRDEASDVADVVRFDRRYVLPALLAVDDRTSSAFSLESRVPLLDRRVVAFVESLPDAWLIGDGEPKGLLRRAAGDDLPSAARRRRDKMGFPVPLVEWARGPWRAALTDLLGRGVLRERGELSDSGVERLLRADDVAGRELWSVVQLELWMREHA